MLKHITSWRASEASEASETVLGVDNAKSGICYYVWMVRAGNFFLQKHGFLGLTTVYSETTALS